MRDEVEWEVERRDRADDADRDTEREGDLAGAGGRRVHRDDVAGELAGLDGSHRERGLGARRLDPCRLHGLAGFGRDRPRDLFAALLDEARGPVEDRSALMRRKRLGHRALRGVDRSARLAAAALRDAPDERAVVGRQNLQPVAGLDPLAADQDLALGRRGGHGLSVEAPRAAPGACALCSERWPRAYLVDAVRSPIGRRNGSLSEIRADELAAQVLNGLVGRVDLDPGEIEDVQMGCVTQVGEQALNVGRGAVLVAGWPETVCATTVDRQCGSSLQTAFNAASTLQAGHLDLVVAAGVEHMTRVPMGSNLGDLGWGAVNEKIGERWPIVPQGISAEVIAEEWNLSREALDEYSLESHRRAVAATDEGRFENEIVPIEVGAGGAVVLFAVDETPRRDTSLEKLASLQPAFKADGVVTAGNSSSIVDGSAAMLLASEAAVAEHGLEPRARFVSFGLSGVDPYRMLHGNPEACERALAKAGLGWDDISVIEVNEAFASVVLQFLADTGLHARWERGDVNPNGGGISLGHPLGATGARITATLLNELERREAQYGIATMCIGQGQAIAGVLERL